MAVGILDYGVYLPYYRIKSEEYTKAWGSFAAGGVKEKTVLSYDEDAITMALAAGQAALADSGVAPAKVKLVYLASTSLPYDEKLCAATVAAGLGIGPEARIADFTGSPRAGTLALLAAFDWAAAHPEEIALVVASDAPKAAPDANLEHALGAGAAAFVVGSSHLLASFKDSASTVRETLGERSRRRGDDNIRDLELRGQPVAEETMKAIRNLLGKLKLDLAQAAQIIIQQPDGREAAGIAGKLKAAKEQQAFLALAAETGFTAAASTLLALAAALDEAKVGDLLLASSYGEGSDALALTVEAGISARKAKPKVKALLAHKEYIDYVTYLKLKRYLSTFKSY